MYYGWYIAGALAITETVSYGVLFYAFSVFIQPMEAELGWSRAEISGAFSLSLLLTGLVAFPVGYWLDKRGSRLLMTAGSVGATVMVLLWSRVNSLPEFMAVMALMGLCSAGVLYEPAFVVITAWFTEKRGAAMALLTFVAGFAATIFIPLAAALLQAFGASTADIFRSTDGWVVSIFVSEAALILSIYAVMAGLNIAANEEQAGILDVLLSLPISRRAYLLEKWAAYGLISLGILLLCAALPALAVITLGVDADLTIIIGSILNIYPGLLLVTTITALFTVLCRRRFVAIGAVAAFVIGSYILNIIGNTASGAVADLMQQLSYFHHVFGEDIVLGSYSPTSFIALLLVTLVGVAACLRLFNHRDIGL